MQSRLALAVLVLAGVALSPLPSRALAILPVQDDRSVSVAYLSNPGLDESAVPVPPFSDFDAFVGGVGIANASQLSTIDTTAIHGFGGSGVDGSGDGSGAAVFDLTFQVDEPVAYSFSGYAYFEPDSQATVALFGPGGALFEPGPTWPGLDFSTTGVLAPGTDYRLVVAASHPDGMDFQATQWSFDFAISAVPEPGSGLLCALALLAAVGLSPRPRP